MTALTDSEDDQGFAELVGELCVVLPGAQVLFAFPLLRRLLMGRHTEMPQ